MLYEDLIGSCIFLKARYERHFSQTISDIEICQVHGCDDGIVVHLNFTKLTHVSV